MNTKRADRLLELKSDVSSLEAVDKDLKAELKDREEDMTRLAKDTARLQLLVHTLRDKMSLELTANRQFRQNIADLKDGQVSASGFFVFCFFFWGGGGGRGGCVPQIYLWGSPLLGEIFAYVAVF